MSSVPRRNRADARVQASGRDLIDLRHRAAGLSLKAHRVRSLHGQSYLSPFKGRGMEFDESRPYQAGDDIRNLDWRVTARTGKAYTKLFREERERPVLLLVDQCRSMRFATRGSFKSVQAAHCAALLSWAAIRQGDRLGGLVFNEQRHREQRPALGTKPGLRFLNLVADATALDQNEDGDGRDALTEALARLRRVSRPGSLITIISDFRQLDDSGESHLLQMARHNEVILVFTFDAMEEDLPPPGRYRITDGQREQALDTTGRQQRQAYAQRFQQRREQLQRLAHGGPMQLVSLATDQDPLEALQTGLVWRRY